MDRRRTSKQTTLNPSVTTREFGLFVDTIELHEEREAESVGWLAVYYIELPF